MSLKELTAEKHKLAETTKFMKAVFASKMDLTTWADWTYQRSLFYDAIEHQCNSANYLKDLPGIQRSDLLKKDWLDMVPALDINHSIKYRGITMRYYVYILSLDPASALSHLYVWHMGDMFGGQLIKTLVNAPHASLEFENAPMLIANLRAKLSNTMGTEANIAFDWAIKIMESYDM
jgi:heme oxygenase